MPKQVNTFDGGMNKDVNVLMQPKNTYRDMHNGMLISYDGNHYVVETALGNTVSFTIPPRYQGPSGTIGVPSTWALDIPPMPIGMISFVDKLVVFSVSSTGGYGEIGVVTFDNSGNGSYLPIYNDVGLNFSQSHMIFGFTYAENDKIERVYWTDNFNELRVINTVDPLLTAYYLAAGPLVTGTEYMVVNGAIEYPSGSGQFFGPGLTLGNLFTAGGTTAYTVADNGNNPTGVPIVVQYLDYHLLSFNPDRLMGNIGFAQGLTGTLNGGSKMFFYRLKLASEGYVTSWSYGSFPINVHGPLNTSWQGQQGAGAGGTLANSGMGIEITISNIDQTFDTIEIAMAEFDQTSNVLTDAKIVNSSSITGTSMNFQIHGGENIQALSINDLTIFPASIITCKDLCTAKNYITIANLKERDEIDFDTTGITIANTVYLMPADQYGESPSNVYQGTTYLGGGISATDLILPDGHYLVSGGAVSYNAVTYNAGQVFIGVGGGGNWSAVSGTPSVNGCISIEKFATNTIVAVSSGNVVVGNIYYVNGVGGDTITYNGLVFTPGQTFVGIVNITTFIVGGGATVTTGKPTNNIIPIYEYWDYKGMAATQYLRQYWTNETYRFGILFYDKKGNPFFVRWIGDFQIQNPGNTTPPIGITTKGGLLKNTMVGGTLYASLRANGIKVSGINISPTLANQISGFSIVRAPRDKQYLAQGITFPTVHDQLGANTTHPMAECELDQDNNWLASGGVLGGYTWHSPDQLCNSSVFINSAGVKLEGEFFANTTSGSGPINSSGGATETFNKYYTSAALSVPYSENILNFISMVPDGSYGAFGGTFQNAFCRRSSDSHSAKGGNSALIQTQNGINYPLGMDVATNGPLQAKAIMNYKTPKATLYGGQSADAIANTPFISTGHFQPFNINDAAFIGTLPVVAGNYQFNDVEVYGGDSFVSIMDHAKCLYEDVATNGPYSYGIFFPVESNVNHNLRQGRTLSRDGAQFNPGNGIWWANLGSTHLESFLVNDAYTTDGTPFEYPALPNNFNITDKFPFRVRWAGPKIAGEKYDVFRTFLLNNFRDLDGNRGEINNVASKQGKIYFWQNHGVGYLPILERQMTSGAVGQAVQLGVGGVIDRFDEYTTYFGNQHQSGLIDAEYGYSWFDMRKRAWVIMNVGGGTEEISVSKGLQSFFYNAFNNQTFTPSVIDTDTPLVGRGIVGAYDPFFKTTFLTFKNYQLDPYVNYDFTVGWNHVKNVMVGFFGCTPNIWHTHNTNLLSAKNAMDLVTTRVQPSTSYVVGDEAQLNGIEYVCIKPFTTHSTVQPYELPDFVGTTLWARLYASNEVYKQWLGADLGKYYGKVFPFIIESIINPPTGEAMSVDNLQIKSSPVNFDTVVYSTDNDTAQDTNLALGNRDYRYIDNSWFNTVALGTKGRLTDYYLKVRMTLNQFTANPTISNNTQKVVEFIGSMFRIKK